MKHQWRSYKQNNIFELLVIQHIDNTNKYKSMTE